MAQTSVSFALSWTQRTPRNHIYGAVVYSYLSLVVTVPTRRGMARLSWPRLLVPCRDGLPAHSIAICARFESFKNAETEMGAITTACYNSLPVCFGLFLPLISPESCMNVARFLSANCGVVDSLQKSSFMHCYELCAVQENPTVCTVKSRQFLMHFCAFARRFCAVYNELVLNRCIRNFNVKL